MAKTDSVQLEEYAELEGTELGNYCMKLITVREFEESYGMTSKFSDALDEEIHGKLEFFRENARIVERWERREARWHELEWNDTTPQEE